MWLRKINTWNCLKWNPFLGNCDNYALTLNEIGEEFGLTRERVRQIKEKAIRRLRHRSRSKKLRTYLG